MPRYFTLLLFVFLIALPRTEAATKTWVGADGASWNIDTNWDPVGKPTSLDDVVITGFVGTIVMNTSPIIQSLNVINGADVVLAGNLSGRQLTISCTGCSSGIENAAVCTFSGTSGTNACDLAFAGTPTLKIDGTLTFSGGGSSDLFANHANVLVNGSLTFAGAGNSKLVCTGGLTTVNGEIVYTGGGATSGESTSNLIVNGGAFYELAKNGGAIPNASWAATSTVKITGMTTDDPSFTNNTVLGNLIWSCPDQTAPAKLDVNLSLNRVDILETGTSEIQVASTNANQTRTWTVNGDYTQNGGVVNLSSGNNGIGKIIFKGSNMYAAMTLTETSANGKGIIEFGGSQQQTAYFGVLLNTVDVIINTSDQVLLNTLLTINNQATLTLSHGNVVSSTQNLLTLSAGALVSGGSTSSHISGPVRKVGNTAFTFPVGKGSTYAPISITAPAAVTDTFTAEYFDNPYTNTSNLTTPLVRVSTIEHWELTHNSGSSPVQVTLSWLSGPASGIDDLGSLTVARFDGSAWVDAGGTASGTVAAGAIQSGMTSAFDRFTFGAKLPAFNPLPIELAEFYLTPLRTAVALHWSTETEQNNAYFAVERSADGVQFTEIGRVPGAGTSADRRSYEFTDGHPIAGRSYYRLRQVDHNDVFSYSPVRTVLFGAPALLFLYPSPAEDLLHVRLTEQLDHSATWQIFNAAGQLMVSGQAEAEAPGWGIPVNQLPAGTYLLRLETAGRETFSTQFLKR